MRNVLIIILLLSAFSCNNPVGEERIINSSQLSKIISQKNKTLVYIWTTWCSGCRYSLAHTLPQLLQDIDTSEYQLLLIAASKNKKAVDSIVNSSNLKNSSWFLDFVGPDKGKFQTLGIHHFLTTNFKEEKIYKGGIPVFFMVDRNMKIVQKSLPHSYDEAIRYFK